MSSHGAERDHHHHCSPTAMMWQSGPPSLVLALLVALPLVSEGATPAFVVTKVGTSIPAAGPLLGAAARPAWASPPSRRTPLGGTSMSAALDRRKLLGSIAGGAAALGAALPAVLFPASALAVPAFVKEAVQGLDSYAPVPGSQGLFFKDTKLGIGKAPGEGDKLRIQFAAYTKEGKLLSRREGVEQATVLGTKDSPQGLQEGLKGMKVGGERLLVIPPELGWSSTYRATGIAAVKGCDNDETCALSKENAYVRVVLVGYKRAECAGGDMPIALDTTSLMTDGKVLINFGTDKCPEGDVEVTYDRVKTKMMLDGLKSEGKLKAAEKQRFYTPTELKQMKSGAQ